jgi:hypothetical protein
MDYFNPTDCRAFVMLVVILGRHYDWIDQGFQILVNRILIPFTWSQRPLSDRVGLEASERAISIITNEYN